MFHNFRAKVVFHISVRIHFSVRQFSGKMSFKVEDNRLSTFTRICNEIAEERSYLNKAAILKNFLQKGCNKKEFQGDLLLWVRMLIPADSQRVYNLQNKQMLKLFSRLFSCDAHQMHLDLEQEGDVSETLRKFFADSSQLKPQKQSSIYLQDVEEFLQKLEQKTKEDEQTELLRQLCKQTTPEDLKTIIRIIKQDLRMNAKASHVLAAFGPMAYSSYQATRDLAAVVKQFAFKNAAGGKQSAATPKGKDKKAQVGHVQVMTPISPMLANACNSVDEAFRKSPGGLFSEIKYDGERVQIHKQGDEFKFFSRNLKPVMEHKVKRFKEFIPKAFPGAGDMILDSEIILVDTITGDLLPFGSLGAHKKKEYANAEVCLFVFDIILLNGEDLTNTPCRQRRKILEENITLIKNYVQLSESHFLKTKQELALMTARVLKANLEGVVLKDPCGTYQPGKRGWLKVKKDYLFGGSMADSADLVVLGAWYGSGKQGGVLSIFLMGCHDKRDGLWKTVTKVHTGLEDSTRLEIHDELMKLMQRSDSKHQPAWFLCNKPLMPDFVAKDPKHMPVWEITGAEFTKASEHTANGISIRFPRITRLRHDKSPEQATDLEHLENMYEASKSNVNVDLLLQKYDDEEEEQKDVKINSKINLKGNTTPKGGLKKEKEDSESPKTPSAKKNKKAEGNSNGKRKSKEKEDSESPKTPSAKKNKKAESNSNGKRKSKDLEQDNEEVYIKNKKIRKEEEGDPAETKPVKKQLTLDVLKKKPSIKEETKTIKQENIAIKSEPMQEDEPSTSKAAMEHKQSRLFKNLTFYFQEESAKLARKIEANGGQVIKDSKKASIVLHESCNVELDLDECRKMYSRQCHHLSTEWIMECLEQKKLLDYGLYAVVLK